MPTCPSGLPINDCTSEPPGVSSSTLNPRDALSVSSVTSTGRRNSPAVRASDAIGDTLTRTEQSLAETRSMARTLGHSITDTNEWDDDFRRRLGNAPFRCIDAARQAAEAASGARR